jgi:hypothetical protein
MIQIAKLLPALMLFIRFFVTFLRWSTNALQDKEVSIEEVNAATLEFWPKKNAEGKPLPIRVPWA